jgi:hypothetical protein
MEHLMDFRSEGAYGSGQYFAIALHLPTCDDQHFIMGVVAVETPESEVVVIQRLPITRRDRYTGLVSALHASALLSPCQ